ncbi:PREDICTED: glutathione S-transferase T3-like [Brassica oleracea var. oleracea]|uniref:glutathione S-transferase T3-like n=1 Tax=Brassica oleracea var. oleracea TaxID=109376 RepID=UPI0006A6B2E2|nr:PREDICTED: glutathione S-transferase T3-like [Brassica oleracea var. oleracea]
MNPGSQYPGYVDYLHSVSGNNAQGNFPYESFPYSLNLGASQIPHFSSQQTEAPSQPDNPPVETPVERMVRKKWNLVDDEVLISAWLITSKDAVVGTEQKLRNFWKRVGHYFSAAHHEKRDGEHCKQRWHKINGDTNKYCAAYAAAERLQSSGQNDNDLVKKAHEIYFADHGSKFTLDHAWCLLRYEQKWLSLNTPKSGGEKRKTGEVGSQASSSNVGEEEPRPEGIKAAKARRNSRKGMAVEDFKSVHELKMEDLNFITIVLSYKNQKIDNAVMFMRDTGKKATPCFGMIILPTIQLTLPLFSADGFE